MNRKITIEHTTINGAGIALDVAIVSGDSAYSSKIASTLVSASSEFDVVVTDRLLGEMLAQ
ncbi:MAG: hypothetical protein FWG83_06780 [Oscillospiraceae bacterium]|nr:hypothetical protein [Oscillospiraceae bacterium]